jgi:hypothetical protein
VAGWEDLADLPVVDHDALQRFVDELLHATTIAAQRLGGHTVVYPSVIFEVNADSECLKLIGIQRCLGFDERSSELLSREKPISWNGG